MVRSGLWLELNLLTMPTWAMITVIVGWSTGWSAINGASKMTTRGA